MIHISADIQCHFVTEWNGGPGIRACMLRFDCMLYVFPLSPSVIQSVSIGMLVTGFSGIG